MKQLFFIRNMVITDKNRSSQRKHSHGFHELVFCHEGNGFQSSNSGEEAINKGTLAFYPAEQRHSIYCKRGQSCRISQIYFSQELFSESINAEKDALFVLGQIKIYARRRSLIILSGIGSERIGKICESMLWEFRNRYRGYSWAIKHKLIEFLITVLRDNKFKAPVKGSIGQPLSNSHIQDVCMYVQTNYMNPVTIKDILQFCPLSRSHFHSLFKKETGKTFTEYLNLTRCQKAEELLVRTKDSILEVSLECGFNNLSHFYHIFKALKGVSPGEFRASNPDAAKSVLGN